MKLTNNLLKLFVGFASALIFMSCQQNEGTKAEIEQLIPPESAMVIKFYEYTDWEKTIQGQSLLSKNQNHSVLKYFSASEFKNIIDIPDNALWSYSILGKDKLVKTLIFESQNDLKLKVESKSAYEYNGVKIKTYPNAEENFFFTDLGGHQIMSDSKIILENIIRNFKGNIQISTPVKRFLEILSDDTPSVIINTDLFSDISKGFFKSKFPKDALGLSNYIGFDLNFDEQALLMSGIVFKTGEKTSDWMRLSRVDVQNSVVAEIIPKHFTHATSVLISDYQKIYPNNESVEIKSENDSLWYNIKEIADIALPNGNAFAMVSKNVDQTYEVLKRNALPNKNFGANQIYKLKETLSLGQKFSDFISSQKIDYFVVFQDIIVCSKQLETLEDIIIQVNNQNVLSQQANYKNHLKSLNTQSHVLWFTALNHQKTFFENRLQPEYQKEFQAIDWSEHDLMISQLIVEDDFAYFNILQKENQENTNQVNVEQVLRLKSENTMITRPQFFKNWRTGQQDVVFQDDKNILRLVDTKGNLIWTKQLESPIVGKVSQIDIFQNTRIQMAFATQRKVYVLDKNGKEVSPFPLDFKDEITQDLSVFDYDKNGRYRLIVVMDNKIRMYDKEGKRIRGFKFKKTKTPLAQPLKHIRIGRKDYILAQEESGQLHILSRTGKTRVEMDNDLRHTDNPWFENDGSFVSVNDNGQILKIDQSGKLKLVDKSWINPKFMANADVLVSMSENQLYINENKTELPYGVYTKPIIKGKYIGIADTQTQKIYLLDSDGNKINGFPIYGLRITDAYSIQNQLVLLCQDESNAVLVYRVNFQ